MRTRRRRRLSLAAGVAVLAAALAAALAVVQEPPSAAAPVTGELPGSLATRLAQLKTAVPGASAGLGENPEALAAETIDKLAYPAGDVALANLEAALAAAAAVARRGAFAKGKGRPGTWVTYGPSNAVYPKTPLRTSYVSNEYVAGGRTTALAIAPSCKPGDCRLWIATSGGGIWRTENALAGTPHWTYLSRDFGINAIGSITLDPNDPSGNTLWVGTGEANGCASGCLAGVGIYRSTDGGDSWQGPFGAAEFSGRAVGSIAVEPGNPSVVYAASTRAVRALSSVPGGADSLVPGAAAWGLYRSTDRGQTWTFVHNGATTPGVCTFDITGAQPCSTRGVRRVALDPVDPAVVYASSYSRGIWRSPDRGATWTQILEPIVPVAQAPQFASTERLEFAVAELENGKTRMYAGGGPNTTVAAWYARVFRSDDVRTGTPAWTSLTSPNVADIGYATQGYCTPQCSYDNYIYSPPGHPDVVYVQGDQDYNDDDTISNGRGLLLSTDAGATVTDLTEDDLDPVYANGIHPDHHMLVTVPGQPFRFIDAGDGGLMRSSGQFADASSHCDTRTYPAGAAGDAQKSRCKQLLSRVPSELEPINKGLTTLQFWSLSVSPHNPNVVQGGTQDNGTWQTNGNPTRWEETIWGDGGQSGFDVANPDFRFHTYFYASPEVNFQGGAIPGWIWIADTIFLLSPGVFGAENASFYFPIISDPKVSGTMYAGLEHVWRTKTHGLGSYSLEEMNLRCNSHNGIGGIYCGDWEPLGTTWTRPVLASDPLTNTPASTRLTAAAKGDRAGGYIARVQRAAGDASTLWAATSTGRVFVSRNADAANAADVTFTRIDGLSAADPARFVSGIYVDPADANHAFVTYSGFNVNTPAQQGHLFEVRYDPAAGTATWTRLDGTLGDLPLSDVVRDEASGDLYV